MAKVLVCDDESMNRELASKILIREGFEVLEALNGEDALRVLQNNQVELILMDLMMPIMDGYEAIVAIKNNPKLSFIPIIVVSALFDKDAISKGLSLGANDYLTKPFNIMDFKIRVINGAKIGEYQNFLHKEIDRKSKEQEELKKLNLQVLEQKKELDALYEYNTQQQFIAKDKLDLTIVEDTHEDFNTQVIFKAADILSGDFYSIHLLKNKATFAYVIDGQGHGVSPALSVFAVSATISNILEDENISFEDIVKKLFPRIQSFLGEIEQLSYTMIYLEPNQKEIKYLSGGMYPFMVKSENRVLSFKANNLPFMNFSPTPKIDSIDVENWSDIIIYTDGLVEDSKENMDELSPLKILDKTESFATIKEKIKDKSFEDDITVLYLKK